MNSRKSGDPKYSVMLFYRRSISAGGLMILVDNNSNELMMGLGGTYRNVNH